MSSVNTDFRVKECMKTCPMCLNFKDANDFYVLKNGKLYGYCKPCVKLRNSDKKQYRKLRYISNAKEINKKSGIYQKEERKKYPEKFLLRRAKCASKRKGVDFDLKERDIFIPTHCPVLNIPLLIADKRSNNNSPSLDRMIPELGYIKNNVQVISWRANMIKNNATIEELEKIIDFLQNPQTSILSNGETIEKSLIYLAKWRAKRDGIIFDLKPEDVCCVDVCPLLNIPLKRGVGKSNFQDCSPTLDRIKPELGYVKGNVQLISYKANRIKNNASLAELKLVLEYMKKEVV